MKTCKHGHEMTPENTVIRTCGKVRCRECQRVQARAKRRRNMEEAKAWKSGKMTHTIPDDGPN